MILMRLWLGIELVACDDDGSHLCPFCRQPAVAFGDHFLSCEKYEFHPRHTAVVDTLTHFIRAAGQRVANEVGVVGRERSADLCFSGALIRGPGCSGRRHCHPSSRPLVGPICSSRPQHPEDRKLNQNFEVSAYFC